MEANGNGGMNKKEQEQEQEQEQRKRSTKVRDTKKCSSLIQHITLSLSLSPSVSPFKLFLCRITPPCSCPLLCFVHTHPTPSHAFARALNTLKHLVRSFGLLLSSILHSLLTLLVFSYLLQLVHSLYTALLSLPIHPRRPFHISSRSMRKSWA